MSASQLSVSSHDYNRLLEAGNLAFFSRFSCFYCGSRLWRNGFRDRKHPFPIKLVRLCCSNSTCSAHYTVYPSDVLPWYRHTSDTIFQVATTLNAGPNLERSFNSYQHLRERRIEDQEAAGPDVSTLRRWVNSLNNPSSQLSLFLSAREKLALSDNRFITVISLLASLVTKLLEIPLPARKFLSPILQVTESLKRVNGVSVTQNNLNFNPQEHPP